MFQIKHRWSGAVLFELELSAGINEKSYGIKLGFAIKANTTLAWLNYR